MTAHEDPLVRGRAARCGGVAAWTAAALAALFIALVAGLHLMLDDLDPARHMLSEYALGPEGWIMALAFHALAAAYAALAVALWHRLWARVGRIGLVVLLVAAAGLLMAGLFPMELPQVPAPAPSLSARLHGVAALLGIPGSLLAASLIGAALARSEPRRLRRAALLAPLAFMWLAMLVLAASVAQHVASALPPAEWRVGWANRALSLSHAVWVIVLALHAGGAEAGARRARRTTAPHDAYTPA